VQLCAADDSSRNAAILVADLEATSALVGGGPRPSFTTSARRLAWGAGHP